MVDLKKSSADTEIRNQLQALTVTNQRLNDELQTVNEQLREINSDVYRANYKFDGDIDRLNYKVGNLNADVRELRREIHELDRTIYKMRESILDAIRNNRSGFVDWIAMLAPILIVGTGFFFAILIKLLKS